MTTPRSFIIIKGEPKALQIEKIAIGENGVYNIKFKSSPTTFHYRANDVIWLKDAVWHNNLQCKVYIDGIERKNVSDIRSFQQGNLTHWRITYSNGYIQDYKDGTIRVVESCLADEIAKNSFEYLKRVAQTNELGKDENHGGILPAIYENIHFIEESLSIAPYLDPDKHKIRKTKSPSLIFPFGCNASQEKAVTAAFENQISVIQGPPGTGKTQTILNIIANILLQGKTVIVVSNNNSATTNVQEKLYKYGIGFIVAALGNKDNKEAFIKNQPSIPDDLTTWNVDTISQKQKRHQISTILYKLKNVFALQEELAQSKQERKEIELEWEHFKQDNNIDETIYKTKPGIDSSKYMNLWLHYQAYIEDDYIAPSGFFAKIKEKIKWIWINLTRKHILGINASFETNNLQATVLELQSLYYIARLDELKKRISKIDSELALLDDTILKKELESTSMELLKGILYDKYYGKNRITFIDTKDLRDKSGDVINQYPVILSTTFSAKISLVNTTYDYLIMDEASQVSVETGALAMTCAKNAVIVGDSLQLPNVVTEEDKIKLDAIFNNYNVKEGYNSSKYSFLESVCKVIPDVTQTLLREHYRCHPKIINFCNQKFYGGKLLIMTKDNNEENVLSAIKTVPGEHCRGHYNQREIDVIKKEVLPNISDKSEIGIISPYNSQVAAFKRQIPEIETATVHKYQGREKDSIIISVVDDQISEFSDDKSLLNVAISRAKKNFCIVLSGNNQNFKGNISELVDYISYNNCSVSDSKIRSVFDYLYSHYTEQRISYMKDSQSISKFDSENLTYILLKNIIDEFSEFSHLGILCHTPIRNIIQDWSLMNEDEKCYVSHYTTHLDFLLINHVTKKPVLAIETDGYNYHKTGTKQYNRDIKKNHILELYGIPLLRLSTNESEEKNKIVHCLKSLNNI